MAARRLRLVLGNRPGIIGEIVANTAPGKFDSSFRYSDEWLGSPERFELDPALPLTNGIHRRTASRGASPFHGVFSDSAPDGWALIVMARRARHQGLAVNLADLTPVDLLLSVSDEHRVGALRYLDEGGSIANGNMGSEVSSTLEVNLSDLLNASEAIERDEETESDLQLLAGEGTSLGGLRPKASVKDEDGALWIAKFPSVRDTLPVTRGEALALEIARQTGLRVPGTSLMDVRGAPVLLVERFDRTTEGARRHYASGFTMLQVDRQLDGSYVGMAERLRQIAERPGTEMRELFQRMLLNVLINNTDDHLGNHGFLYVGGGFWGLSPVFDINPFPTTRPELKTAISRRAGHEASLAACLPEAAAFGLSSAEAAGLVEQVQAVTARWKEIATSPQIGMTEKEADLFGPAFTNRIVSSSSPKRRKSLPGDDLSPI